MQKKAKLCKKGEIMQKRRDYTKKGEIRQNYTTRKGNKKRLKKAARKGQTKQQEKANPGNTDRKCERANMGKDKCRTRPTSTNISAGPWTLLSTALVHIHTSSFSSTLVQVSKKTCGRQMKSLKMHSGGPVLAALFCFILPYPPSAICYLPFVLFRKLGIYRHG